MRLEPTKRYIFYGFLVIFLLLSHDTYSQVCSVSGGQISTTDPILICRKDNTASPFTISLINSSGPFDRWLITNQNGLVLFIQNELPLDLSELTQGIYIIYHISFDEIALGISIGNNIDDFGGCFELSNPLTIVIDEVNGGRVTDELDNESRSVCTDRIPQLDLQLAVNGALGFNKRWILTDTLGTIEILQETGDFSFSNITNTTKRIYHISYASIENLFEGSNLNDLIGCFDLSNSYEIFFESNGSEAGILTTSSPSSFCSGDGENSLIQLSIVGNNSENNLLVLTDLDDFILKITTDTSINIEGVSTSRVTVRNIQFNETITGLEIGRDFKKLEGCFDTSNEISFSINYVNGGQISGQDGKREFFFCTGDNVPDNVNLSFDGVIGQNSAVIVTDRLGDIVDITTSNVVSFEGEEGGTFFIHNLAYNGDNFNIMLGQNITTLSGCFDFSNQIAITKSSGTPDAGVISTDNNMTLCTGDSTPDIVDVLVEDDGANNSIWVFTDTNDNIIDFPGIPPFNFSDSTGSEEIIIRYIDFTGIDNLRLGGNLNELEGCFDISNPLSINRNGVRAGAISFRNDKTTITECASSSDIIDLDILIDESFGNVQHFIITNAQDSILKILEEPIIDLSSMSAEALKIRYISMLDSVENLAEGNKISDLDGCFDLSNELFVEFENVTTTASVISTNASTTLCLNDNSPDIIQIDVLPGVGPLTSWVVTDEFGEILHIQQNGKFNLATIPGDENRIFNIKHTSNARGIEIGSFLSGLEGCFSISNQIAISKGNNSGGELSYLGSDQGIICLSDGTPPIIEVDLQNNFGQSSRFLITRPDGEIEKIINGKILDFSGLGSGKSMVYNISFTSGIQGIGISNNINQIQGCYEFSNPLSIDKYFIEPGTIAVNGGQEIVDICAGEGIVDLITVDLKDNVSPKNRFIITDEQGEIVALPSASDISFESGPTGNYYLYNLAYADDVDNINPGVKVSDLNGCFELSNAVTIKSSRVSGGELSFQDEGKFYEACISTPGIQALTLNVQNNSGNSVFIETNPNGEILKIFQDRIIDLSDIRPGQCQIYNVSYFEVNGLEVGNNINQISGCYSISNDVLIDKREPKGGTLTDAEGNTEVELCVGDNSTRLIDVRLNGVSGPNSDWILTDVEGKILSTDLLPPFNLETNEMEELMIYNLAYETGLRGLQRGNTIDLLEGCYEFSNPIRIKNNIVETYSLLVTESFKGERTMCVDDDDDDILEIGTIGNVLGDEMRFIIVDETGKIEEIKKDNVVNFTGYKEGISNVYQVSYLSGLDGLKVDENISNLDGCFAISEPIKIIRVSGAECLTSFFEIDGKQIDIDLYPNPVKTRLYVKANGLEHRENLSFSIIDMTGKLHRSWNSPFEKNGQFEFPVDGLPRGLYFLQIIYGKESGTLKFIKE